MSDSLKHKLLKHEVVPPPSAWNKISARLQEEYDCSDAAISARLEKTSAPAPATAWNNIADRLNSAPPELNKPSKLIPLFYKRLSIAVILTGITASSVLYLFMANDNRSSFANGSNVKKGSLLNYMPAVSPGNQPVPSPSSVIGQKPRGRSLTFHEAYKRIAAKHITHSPDVQLEQDPLQDLSYLQGVQTDVQTVSALKPVNVEAPLIRDKNGNIIMDMKLISAAGNHFITVTSPNGTQTKISSKFLPCLSYLNDDRRALQTDQEGIECSNRFREWRDKLLSQAAYVPSANNFFDIFELQQLIQD